MPDPARHPLDRGQVIDITTTGRRTGLPRRIEIAIHNLDGRLFISGIPSHRTRAWIRNLAADPRLTIHTKGQGAAELAATARIVDDPAERRRVLDRIARIWGRTDVDRMVELSPLIEVLVEGYPEPAAA